MDAGLARVYRFFATEPELLGFFEGSWQGKGVHGFVGAVPEERVWLLSRFLGDEIFLQLQSIPMGRSRKSFFRKRFFRPPVSQSKIAREWKLQLHVAELQMDVDLGMLHWPGQLQLAIQALEEDRVHCQLELFDAGQKQLFFSGVIERKK